MIKTNKGANPDILSCLANLSSDEVFTSPELVNNMLDMLPQELFRNPDTKFLDPACKSGVFLREITKRLINGLEDVIPDLQERVDHILHNQVYGIAITELTSYISRRSLYCSKYPNGEFSISKFDTPEGNIVYRRIEHTWQGDKCAFCGANKKQYKRSDDLESHAYNFIHLNIEKLFNMKFDVIISNPPYQLNTGGTQSQAIPIYQKFVEVAQRLKPGYVIMIMPSRWYAGGMGLDSFRDKMLSDSRIRVLVDYPNAKDCFPGVSIGGGICYFLWDRDHRGVCRYTCNYNDKTSSENRNLNEFPTFIRYNEAISVVRKVKEISDCFLSDIVTPLSPFGLDSAVRGNPKKTRDDDCIVYSSQGNGYIARSEINHGIDLIDKYKILVAKTTSEHANEADKNGQFRVLSRIQVLGPAEVCTFSYFVMGGYEKIEDAKNLLEYLKTKFVRFLLLQSVSSINLSKDKFQYIPLQDFSKKWTDAELYKKYNLSGDEIAFIEDMIKPME